MSEVHLSRRYPNSQLEDITDAYMRGFENGLHFSAVRDKKLEELVRDLYHFAIIADVCPSKCPIESRCDNSEYCLCNELFDERMRELGIEVE